MTGHVPDVTTARKSPAPQNIFQPIAQLCIPPCVHVSGRTERGSNTPSRPIIVIQAMTPYTSAPTDACTIAFMASGPTANSALVPDKLRSAQKAKCPMSTLSSRYHGKSLFALLSLAAASLLAAGCGGSVATNPVTGGVSGPSFVVGTDAPMASVSSFAVQINSIDAINAGGQSVSLISGSPTVDFARFNGLQTLLDMNDVPVGTYTSIQISLGSATLGYLNVVSGSAPTIQSEAGDPHHLHYQHPRWRRP